MYVDFEFYCKQFVSMSVNDENHIHPFVMLLLYSVLVLYYVYDFVIIYDFLFDISKLISIPVDMEVF